MTITTLTPRGRKALLEHVADLRTYKNLLVSAAGAEHFSKAFGFPVRTRVYLADAKSQPGLRLYSGKRRRGIAAEALAIQICDHFGVTYPERFERDEQLRCCCDALEAHFTKMPMTPRLTLSRRRS